MPKKIYLIRHGETDMNRNHIVQGSGVDSSLNATGLEQGRLFYEQYKHLPFELVITSKLKRTTETVQHFIKDGIPTERFAEIN